MRFCVEWIANIKCEGGNNLGSNYLHIEFKILYAKIKHWDQIRHFSNMSDEPMRFGLKIMTYYLLEAVLINSFFECFSHFEFHRKHWSKKFHKTIGLPSTHKLLHTEICCGKQQVANAYNRRSANFSESKQEFSRNGRYSYGHFIFTVFRIISLCVGLLTLWWYFYDYLGHSK